MVPSRETIVAVIATQRLFFFRQGQLIRQMIMSSSRVAPSNRQDSGGTPPGLHEICEVIGTDAPVGTVFRARKPVAASFLALPEADCTGNLITSRILRLRGLEPGLNAGAGIDSYERYIYVHGTHRPESLGTPFSGGCLLLSDADIVWLAAETPVGSMLLIENGNKDGNNP